MASCDFELLVEGMREGELSRRLLPIDKIEENLKNLALSISPRNDPLQELAQLPMSEKKKIFPDIHKQTPRSLRPNYRGCIFEVSNYEISKNCGNVSRLQQDKRSKFCIDIDISNDKLHIEDQFMKIRFKKPEIDLTKFNPESIPDFDSSKIRFRYCSKPGIRLLPEYTLMCESVQVHKIDREQLKAMDEQLIQDQARTLWNYLIGEDNGVDTELVLPDTNAVQVTKMKYGFQTPKEEQDELCIYIPLQFFYNLDFKNRLNTGMFKEGTLSIQGLLERSDLIVRADYYDGLEEEPIRIPCKPLEIAEHRLVTNYIRVGDYLHALDLYSIMSRIIEIVDVHKYHIKDLDNCIVLKGKGMLETMLVYIRPKGYDDDFFLWDKFSEVEEVSTQIPALINDPGGNPGQCGVGLAKHYRQIKNIKEIGLSWGDIDIKEIKPTIFYEVISKHRLSRQTDLFKVQDPENGLYMFLFNDHYLTRQLSCLFNMDSIREPILELKFNEDLIDLEQRLDKEYEITVLSYTLNTISSYGRTMGINYIY